MLLIEKCRDCKHCSSITRADSKHECDIAYKDESKIYHQVIPDPDIIGGIPYWCPLQDAPEEI